VGKGVFVDTKTIRMKSLETVGVVRDNAVTGHVLFGVTDLSNLYF
jgi:hypothetical protein